ncbi:MAG: chloride channel protein [Actinomycetota bacterium]|nr:chloride channel protein [Actinomycetota bacterium]
MEQPNVTGDGDAALTPRFWLLIAFTGVATGLLSDLMMMILFNVQELAFGYHPSGFEAAIERSSSTRRVLSLVIAGLIGGVAWYLLRRYTKGEKSEVDDVIWNGDGRLSLRRSLGTSVISEIVIGMGASLGREAAPKLMGGASASVLAGWFNLTTAQRRLLVACGGGAGFAAVYNVPLGGALFTAEILIGSLSLPVILPAVACSFIATATAWLYLPNQATYLNIPAYAYDSRLLVWALVVGPIIGVFAAGFIRLVGWVSHHEVTGRKALVAPLVAFAILGVIGLRYPQLFGNGKDMANGVFIGGGSLALLAALFILKPLVTSLCLGSGASGGLFTPVMSTGAVFGAFLGLAWSHLWPGSPIGAYAMIGAAAMIGAGMQAPLAALLLVLELTHSGFSIMIPMMAATVIATGVSRHIDGYSIYSARLSANDVLPARSR